MKEKLKIKLKNKRFLIRFLAVIIVLLLLVSASVYTVFIKPGLEEDTVIYKEETVQRGDLVLGIMESGSIELEETTLDYTLDLSTSEEDDSDDEDDDEDDEDDETIKYPEIEEVYVVAGQRIEEGNALFKLTEKSTEAVKNKLNSLYTEAQIAYEEAETDCQTQLLSAKSTYDTSMLEANRAETSYAAASTMTQENVNRLSADIKVLEAEIAWNEKQLEEEELWDSLEEAQETYTSAQNVYNSTDIHNATAYAANYSEYKSAGEQLDSIQDQIDTLNETIEDNKKSIAAKQEQLTDAQGTLEADSLEDESTYDSAVLGGEVAQDIYNYTVDALEEAVNTAEADMEEAKEKMDEFTAFAGEDGVIYADGSGLVLNVAYQEGDDLVTTGAMLSYVKENAYTVAIDVSEEDISAIKVGDQVDVVMTAYPDTTYEGTVTAITTTASSEEAATVSYPVTVKIEGDTSLLYGGMTAEITFVTDSAPDVLYVSKKAIQTVDGKTYVYRDGGAGKRKLTEIETGFSDGTNVEIVEGLEEGDTVYIESRISGSEKELMEETPVGQDQETDSTSEENMENSMPDSGSQEMSGSETGTAGGGPGGNGGTPGEGGMMPDGME